MKIITIEVVLLPSVIPSAFFITDLNSPLGFDHTEPFQLKADLPQMGWQDYLEENFPGIPVKIIDAR